MLVILCPCCQNSVFLTETWSLRGRDRVCLKHYCVPSGQHSVGHTVEVWWVFLLNGCWAPNSNGLPLLFSQWELPGAMGQQGLPEGGRDAQQPEGGLHGGCALSSHYHASHSQGHDLGREAGWSVRRERGLGAEPCSVLSAEIQSCGRGRRVPWASCWEDGSSLSFFLLPYVFLTHSHTQNTCRALCKQVQTPSRIISRWTGDSSYADFLGNSWLTWVLSLVQT